MDTEVESRPQVPKKSHAKNISVTKDVEIEGMARPAMRRNAGVELVPRPSDSPLDPLVHLLSHQKNPPASTDCF